MNRCSLPSLLFVIPALVPMCIQAYDGGATGGFTIVPSSREQARQFYNVIHEQSENTVMNWTGSVTASNAGTTSDNFKKAVMLRVNYFRAMAGMPANVAVNASYSADAQKAALMMSANGMLSHNPPPSWLCYTPEGAAAAANSDLTLANYGPKAVNVYISDDDSDDQAVGHRRWVLFPQTQEMGTGDIPHVGTTNEANALWIIDSHGGDARPATRESYVAWPPPGYVPYQVVFPRWSFGLAGADLTAMTVTMKQGATNLSVSVEPYQGFIGENTRAWVSAGLDPSTASPPASDVPYTVTVGGVRVGGVTQSPFVYTVTVFNPATTGADTVAASLSGPTALNVGQAGSYTHPLTSFASGYDLVEAAVSGAFSETEGAENGLANMTAFVPSGYNPVSTTVWATGTKSFHLTNPNFENQSLTWQRTLLPSASSHLQFKSRLRYSGPVQKALVQLSRNGGVSWTDIYSQAGNYADESGFTQKDVSLAAYAGYPVTVRLLLKTDGAGSYTDTSDIYGWYVDDLTVTAATLLANPTVVMNNTSSSFSYTPTAPGQRALYVRPHIFQNYGMESGVAVVVTVSGSALPELKVNSWVVAGSQVTLEFHGTNLPASPVFKLQTSTNLTTSWTDVATATLLNLGSENYRFTATKPAGARVFFRAKMN